MKFIVAFVCLVGVALAQQDVEVIRNEQSVQPESYSYSYELSNGIAAQESGALKDPETISAQGSFRFTAPDGRTYSTEYTADENGFQPSGEHLPTPPPSLLN